MLGGEKVGRNNFFNFCEACGFIIDDDQRKIINEIFNDIEKDTLISFVLMPNAAGKTNLSLLLCWYFMSNRLNPLLYSPMRMKHDYRYVKLAKENEKYIDQMDYANAGDIRTKIANKYDFIIADGLAYIDINNVKKNDVSEFIQELMSCKSDEIRDIDIREEYLEWMGQRYLSKVTMKSKAKVIIFMKRDDFKLCCKTTFGLSTKKNIIDIYPKSDKKQVSDARTEISQSSYKQIENNFFRQFSEQLDRIECKVDDVSSKVSAVYDIVQNVQKKVEVQKQVISTCSELMDEDNVEALIDKSLSKLMKQMSEEILKLEKMDAFKNYERLVRIRMGDEAWSKLEDESKRFLVTAKFTFAQNIIFGGSEIDYSSICLLASKAFEIELAKRFVVKYVDFLETQRDISGNYEKWPSSVVKYDKDKRQLRPLQIDEFMLGNCPYIFGILESKKRDNNCNKSYFEKYCRSKLMKKEKTNDLQQVIKNLDFQIKTIKDKFRNPAAHKNSISMEEASYCIDYILEVERVLKSMLELFEY